MSSNYFLCFRPFSMTLCEVFCTVYICLTYQYAKAIHNSRFHTFAIGKSLDSMIAKPIVDSKKEFIVLLFFVSIIFSLVRDSFTVLVSKIYQKNQHHNFHYLDMVSRVINEQWKFLLSDIPEYYDLPFSH